MRPIIVLAVLAATAAALPSPKLGSINNPHDLKTSNDNLDLPGDVPKKRENRNKNLDLPSDVN